MAKVKKIKDSSGVIYDIDLPIDNEVKTNTTFSLMSVSSVAGSGTSGSYKSVRWYVSNQTGEFTAPYNGMKVAVKIPLAGVATAGVVFSIDGDTAANYHPVAYNVNSALTSHFSAGSVKILTYDASATMACYLTSNTKTTITGVWKAESDYNSDADTKVRQYQAGTGTRTGTQYPILTRYAVTDKAGSYDANYARFNPNTYVDTSTGNIYAPKVYSNSKEVAVKDDIPTTTSELTNDSGFITNSTAQIAESQVTNLVSDLNNIREVAEGKTANYVVDDTVDTAFNSQNDTITITSSFYDINKGMIPLNTLSVGDTALVTQVNVPDRWVQTINYTGIVKGDLINLNLDGTEREYRVLKHVRNNIYELVAMFDLSTTFTYGSNSTYNGSNLDVYLNETWYNTLTETARHAIVDKTITQYSYEENANVYNNTTHASRADYSTKTVKESNMIRHVYALDVEDIELYFNKVFSMQDIWTLFWKRTIRPTTTLSYPLLRSAKPNNTSNIWNISGYDGGIYLGTVASETKAARPAFQIDLTAYDYDAHVSSVILSKLETVKVDLDNYVTVNTNQDIWGQKTFWVSNSGFDTGVVLYDEEDDASLGVVPDGFGYSTDGFNHVTQFLLPTSKNVGNYTVATTDDIPELVDLR